MIQCETKHLLNTTSKCLILFEYAIKMAIAQKTRSIESNSERVTTWEWKMQKRNKYTLATLTRWLKLSTMLAISPSTLCNSVFCFCAMAEAAVVVGPLSALGAPPNPDAPALFILLSIATHNKAIFNVGRKSIINLT